MMKQFYTVALMGLAALTMSAALRTPLSSGLPEGVTKSELSTRLEMPVKNIKKAPAAKTLDDFCGTYAWSFYNLDVDPSTGQQYGDDMLRIDISVLDASQNQVSLRLSKDFAMTAVVDLAKGTLSIPTKQYLGADDYGDLYFYLKAYDSTTGQVLSGAADVAAAVGTINDQTVTFPDDYIWAIGDPNAENLGWLVIGIGCSFEKKEVGGGLIQVADSWADYCSATFIDGWIVPGATSADPSKYPWTVTVQQNTEEPYIYRLRNPYLDCPYLSGTANGSIVFSVKNPNLVYVYPGFSSGMSLGGNQLYCFNLEGYYDFQGYNEDAILGAFASNFEVPSTYAGTVVNIPTCVFDQSETPTSAYTWEDANGASLEQYMKAVITLDKPLGGIESVSADDSNAPVEYFNLQGMRVDNPANGVFIRRQGKNASKVIFK